MGGIILEKKIPETQSESKIKKKKFRKYSASYPTSLYWYPNLTPHSPYLAAYDICPMTNFFFIIIYFALLLIIMFRHKVEDFHVINIFLYFFSAESVCHSIFDYQELPK